MVMSTRLSFTMIGEITKSFSGSFHANSRSSTITSDTPVIPDAFTFEASSSRPATGLSAQGSPRPAHSHRHDRYPCMRSFHREACAPHCQVPGCDEDEVSVHGS